MTNRIIKIMLFIMRHYRPLFLYLRLFDTVNRKQHNFNIKVCRWLDSNLCCWKKPLSQLSHNHSPKNLANLKINVLTKQEVLIVKMEKLFVGKVARDIFLKNSEFLKIPPSSSRRIMVARNSKSGVCRSNRMRN